MPYDYDLITIGGGAAGLTAAGVAANLGASVLLVEAERLGGDCTWTGCVPSKTLLKTARVASLMRHAGRYGLTDQPVEIDFARVMAHVRATRAQIYEEADRPEIYERMGVTVRHGRARFADPHTLVIEGTSGEERVTGRFIVVATGSRPALPPIEGLSETPYLTNETIFELDERPRRLAILGGGPVGTEMAQAFRRLGSEVTVIDRGARLLRRDDAELVRALQAVLEEEGVRLLLGADTRRVRREADEIVVEVEVEGEARSIRADALLVAAGRQPSVGGLDLDAAGVAYTRRGIHVDGRGRTSRGHIYAAGDVTGGYQFTHMGEHSAKVAVANALLKVPTSIDTKHVPWATFTDPPLAHVGATEAELRRQEVSFRVYRFPYAKIDRAVADGETTGLIKVFARRWSGRILGASILGASAGDLIGEYALAMRHGLSLRQISDTIHPYPTYGLGVRRAADQWYVQNQSPRLVRVLQRVFGYRGPVLSYGPDDVL